jgi:VIT1/CCC1 family predicted Fe2+/Mn2+ transporter
MTMQLSDLVFLGGVPLIIAIVQIAKQWVTDIRYAPVISVITGVILNIFIGVSTNQSPSLSIIEGMVSGLVAAGMYSVANSTQKQP